jgi:hypothetical protein
MSTQPLNGEDAAAIIPAPNLTLAIQRAPEVVLAEAAKAAQALRAVIESKPNKCVINGKTFLQFEDWQTLGRFYGITSAARTTTYLEQGRVRGYECHAEALLVSADQVIGAAQAMCMDDEQKWHDKPLYQLRSMAQTRAQAKALRGVLAWVAVLAGYQATPAEEMDGAQQSSQPVHSSGRIESSVVSDHCQRIGKATNYKQLQEAFRAAYQLASAANDRNAQAAYIAAKDKRLKELR